MFASKKETAENLMWGCYHGDTAGLSGLLRLKFKMWKNQTAVEL